MPRVGIADDHAVVRQGIRQILQQDSQIEVVSEAGNAEEAITMAREQILDLLVLDINMPGRSGLEALKDIRQLRPRLPILVLSMHPEDQLAIRALKAGASGYLTKDSAPDELVNAVRKVIAGGRHISASLAERIVLDLQDAHDEVPHAALSNREFEVLRLIASGKTVSEIADQLSLSVKTVSTYRSRVLTKMSMGTNAELTHYAIRNRLVE